MAVVQGVKERVHMPLYDALIVEPEQQLREVESTPTLKFFVNVQQKTKLETNLQSASLLPHYNTFEARAMRVVISDLNPRFPYETEGRNGRVFISAVPVEGGGTGDPDEVDVAVAAGTLVDLYTEAFESDDGEARRAVDDPEIFYPGNNAPGGGELVFGIDALDEAILNERASPPGVQLRSLNGDGMAALISFLIFNTVTTLYVGEKIMIQMPTWFFPSGTGTVTQSNRFATHGEPSPLATFRFAEPIFIDRNQNFRVEIEVPEPDVLRDLQRLYGPLFIWVVLDGYLTRDVQ
ncbi:MAG TPA: hypothetical protein VD833_14785 [Vicinamibacterales bacterium]|nr:hypothetical protein [Vicinamibacterales bacterium]